MLKRLVCLLVKLHFTIPCISTEHNKDSTYFTQKTNPMTKSNTHAYSFLNLTKRWRNNQSQESCICSITGRLFSKPTAIKTQTFHLSLPGLHKKRKPFRSAFRKWISSEVKTHDVTQGCEKQNMFLTRDCEPPLYITLWKTLQGQVVTLKSFVVNNGSPSH